MTAVLLVAAKVFVAVFVVGPLMGVAAVLTADWLTDWNCRREGLVEWRWRAK